MAGLYDNTISIGELSERTGVSVRALRYYEQHGLLAAVRTSAGQRRFEPGAAETVRRIRLFLDAGLPLSVVSQVIACFVDDGSRLHACVAEYLRDHMAHVRARVEELDQQRSTVRRLQQLIAG